MSLFKWFNKDFRIKRLKEQINELELDCNILSLKDKDDKDIKKINYVRKRIVHLNNKLNKLKGLR